MTGLRLFLLAFCVIGLPVSSPVSAIAASKADVAVEPATKPVTAMELASFARAAREVFRIRKAYAPKVQAAGSEMYARDFIVEGWTRAVAGRQT